MATEVIGTEHDSANASHRGVAVASRAPIVIATDLSPMSTEALVAADVRSRASGAPLIVCHVLPGDSGGYPPENRGVLQDVIDRAAAERTLRAQVRYTTGRLHDGYDVHIGCGLVSRSIAELAEESQASLIVIGHGSAGSVTSEGGGSTSGQLSRLSRSSLLVVRNGRRRGVVVLADGASTRAAGAAAVEATRTDVEVVACGGDAVAMATDRFASLIVIDDATDHDDPADIVRRAPCSVLVIRGEPAF